jgi:hypothetical protein
MTGTMPAKPARGRKEGGKEAGEAGTGDAVARRRVPRDRVAVVSEANDRVAPVELRDGTESRRAEGPGLTPRYKK